MLNVSSTSHGLGLSEQTSGISASIISLLPVCRRHVASCLKLLWPCRPFRDRLCPFVLEDEIHHPPLWCFLSHPVCGDSGDTQCLRRPYDVSRQCQLCADLDQHGDHNVLWENILTSAHDWDPDTFK